MADEDIPEDLKQQLKEQEEAEMKENEKPHPKANGQAKVKTFNRLDPRFQLTDKHDPEHIFPEELEMCKELRKQRPELEPETDKFLVMFLCARRHQMTDTLALLDKYLHKRRELGYDKKGVSHKAFEHVLKMGANLHPPGAVDKHGRLLHYYWIGKDRPKDRTLEEFYAYFFWQVNLLLKTEPLKYIRNGFLFIVNMSGFGWKNLDLSSKGKEINFNLTGLFPLRMRELCIMNGGVLLRAAMQVAKLVFPKKIMKRMHTATTDELKAMVPEQYLHEDYGGLLMMNGAEDWIAFSEDVEKHGGAYETKTNPPKEVKKKKKKQTTDAEPAALPAK